MHSKHSGLFPHRTPNNYNYILAGQGGERYTTAQVFSTVVKKIFFGDWFHLLRLLLMVGIEKAFKLDNER